MASVPKKKRRPTACLPDVDGQVLVLQDMLGMNRGFRPKFLRVYADLASVIDSSLKQYIADVKSSDFPSAAESY